MDQGTAALGVATITGALTLISKIVDRQSAKKSEQAGEDSSELIKAKVQLEACREHEQDSLERIDDLLGTIRAKDRKIEELEYQRDRDRRRFDDQR